MKKSVLTLLGCLALAFCLPVTAFAASPQTGDSSAPVIPIVLGLMAVAIAAIIACLFLFKKKK